MQQFIHVIVENGIKLNINQIDVPKSNLGIKLNKLVNEYLSFSTDILSMCVRFVFYICREPEEVYYVTCCHGNTITC